MRVCRKVGVDVTWRCNWNCAHCFYRFGHRIRRPVDVSLDEIARKVERGRIGGCDHTVMVGFGEPMLHPDVKGIVRLVREKQMSCSIITNGTAPTQQYADLFELGLDHLHLSSHGLEAGLVKITGDRRAWRLQAELKQWMRHTGFDWRVNVTLQQLNYRDLPSLVDYEIRMGAWHIVLLGFLPHYEWGMSREKVRKVAVHPSLLRWPLEDAARKVLNAGVSLSIRYHPLCHLDEDLWPYVTNARYVFMDPFEWNYILNARDYGAAWQASVGCGKNTACHEPCGDCLAYRHCGGWNRVCAEAFDGGGLVPVRQVPSRWKAVWDNDGGLFDLNPVNAHSGTLREV